MNLAEQAVAAMATDKDGKPLVPGALYCCFTVEEGVAMDGALVWYASDGNFYSADDDESLVYPDYDYLIRQVGDVNRAFVEAA